MTLSQFETWLEVEVSQQKKDWKKFQKNNVAIVLNILYAKKEKIYPAYVSKHNSNHEKEVILLMIPNGQGREAKFEGQ